MIATDQLGATHLHRMVTTNHGEVVGQFVAAQDRKIWQEDVSSQIRKTRDVEAYLAWHIWNHVEACVVPLGTSLIQSDGAELVEPRPLDGAVVRFDRTAPREAHQRLHVRTLFQIVRIGEKSKDLVLVAE